MKACVKCGSDLPDSAVHCVFCGAKQKADEPAPAAVGKSKTMMGYPGMAADVLKKAKEQREAGHTPEPVYSDTDTELPTRRVPVGPHSGPGEGPYKAPAPHEKRTMAVSPGEAVGGPPPAARPKPSPSSGPPIAGNPGPGPGGAGPSNPNARTAYVPPGGGGFGAPPPMNGDGSGPVALPPGASGGAPVQAPYGGGGSAPAQAPYGGAPGQPGFSGASPQGYSAPPPGMVGLGGPPGYGPPPGMGHGAQAPAQPPYLASQTEGRSFAPHEPWEQSLKTLLLVFGVLLAACFVAPWSVAGGSTTFSWSLLKATTFIGKLQPLLLAGSAVLALVFAFTPLSMRGRGLAAGLLGLVCLQLLPIIALVQGLGSGFAVMPLVHAIAALMATVTLIPGLLLRAEYRDALLPRVLATIGVLCALAPLLIPVGGSLPIVGVFKAVASQPVQVAAIGVALYVVIVVLGLLVWLPPTTGAGAGILAWLLILQPIVMGWAAAFGGGIDVDVIKAGLSTIFYIPLAMVGWYALCGHGIAAFFGKGLER